jgi:multiple sugar transport system substrate-binding protein
LWGFFGSDEVNEMNKRMIWLALVVALLLVACRAKSEEEPEAPPTEAPAVSQETADSDQQEPVEDEIEPVTVRFAVFDFEQGLYDDLATAFEEENPDVEIRFVSVEETLGLDAPGAEWPDDARRRLVSAADVSSVFYSTEAAQDGLLLDLGPLMEAERDFDAADFLPATLENFQSQGGTWAVPTELNYVVIYYNKDAFDEAGLDYPQPGWSWDDFLAAAEALTVREGDETTQWGFAEISPTPAFFVEGRTGPSYDMTTDPPSANFDDPAVADALRWYTEVYQTHEVAPYFPPPEEEGPGLNIPEGYLVIEQGGAAMWPEASASYPYRSQQMNIGVVPFPVDSPDSLSSRLAPNGLSISVGTANPEAAWRWVDYLSRQTSDPMALFGGRASLPARQSVAEASGFWDEVDESLASALTYAIDHAYVSSAPPGVSNTLGDAFEAIMDGDKTVEEALADAQIAAEEAIEGGMVEGEEGDAADIVVEQSEDEAAASEDAVTIEFLPIMAALEMQTFRDLADQFQEANPDVIVEIKPPNFFEGSPSIKDVAEASDCFQWAPGNFNDPETQAALLNLDPLLDADPEISGDEFYPVVLDAFTAQGQTWGLPGQINITLIEYNKDLFDAAAVDYPTAGWTTDDFLAAAVALTEGEGDAKQYGYVSDYFEPTDMLNMLDRLGANLIDDTADPPVLTLDDPETIEAVRWYTGLTTEHEVKPVLLTDLMGAAVAAVQQRQALLDEGRAAMWTNSAFNVEFGGESERGYSTGAVPLPIGSGDVVGSGYQAAMGYFISADTPARDACWGWIKYLTEQPYAGKGLPSRMALAESSAFRQRVGDELTDAYLASMQGASQPPFSQQVSDENSWLNYPVFWLYGAYNQIVNGEMGVAEALENAQHLVDEYSACVVTAEAFNDDEAQKACMLETDPTLPAILFGPE